LSLNNTQDQKILYKIKLKLVEATDIPNLRWPVNGVRGTLGPNEAANVALLQKVLPTEGMGDKAELEKLEIVLTWKLEPKVDTSGAARVDHDVK